MVDVGFSTTSSFSPVSYTHLGIPKAKAAPWECTDDHVRQRGEQTGLDTLVVHAINDVDLGVEL